MRDNRGRKIDYLRISITDRCNLRCRYCMPPAGVKYKSHDSIIRYEEILRIVEVGIELGVKSIRITGGEPLVRRGVKELITSLAGLKGLEDISMTTNGLLLPEMAEGLQSAGLNRVNISLDSLRRERYAEITGYDGLEQVRRGVEVALHAGLEPVKINTVVIKGVNADEVLDFVRLTLDYPLQVRFIEYMPLGRSEERQFISLDMVKDRIEECWELVPAKVSGAGPARYYRIPTAPGSVGFIHPVSHSFCTGCNRLRLTADGRLRPCLADNIEVDLHDGQGEITSDRVEIRQRYLQAISLKPSGHHFYQKDSTTERGMFQIGG